MTMKARIRTDSMGNITIHMEGGLDYENVGPLEQELVSLSKEHPTSMITIDMTSLSFVGSSGIGIFVETIKTLNDKKDQIRLSNVSSEFLKVFKLYNFEAMDLIMQQFDSDETELSMFYGGKRKTFQN